MNTLTNTADSAMDAKWAEPGLMNPSSNTTTAARGSDFTQRSAAKFAAAAVTFVSTIASVANAMPWINGSVLPETASPWDNSATTRQHPTMTSSAVQQFLRISPQADARALMDIFDVVMAHFSDVPDLGASYSVFVDPDTNAAQLILDIDSRGMDTDEQLHRELLMREKVFSDERMKAAKQYNVISVV